MVNYKQMLANHILIQCHATRKLGDMFLAIFELKWVFPDSVKDLFSGWKEKGMDKRWRRMWSIASFSCSGGQHERN